MEEKLKSEARVKDFKRHYKKYFMNFMNVFQHYQSKINPALYRDIENDVALYIEAALKEVYDNNLVICLIPEKIIPGKELPS